MTMTMTMNHAERAARLPSRDVYCHFDSTDQLHTPDNLRELMQRLGVRKPVTQPIRDG